MPGLEAQGKRPGFRQRLALTTALTTALLGGYGGGGGRAFAGSCVDMAGTFVCSGAADAVSDVRQNLSGAPLTVTTLALFGIDTSTNGGDALTLSGTDGLTFTDSNLSSITGGDRGIDARNAGTGTLSITATGAVTGGTFGILARNSMYGTDLTVSAAAVTGGRGGINAINSGTGALSVTATDLVAGDYLAGIVARNSGTDLTVSAAAVTGGFLGIDANNFGTGLLSVTATGAVTGTSGDGIFALNDGTDLTVTAAAVTGGRDGIVANNFGTGLLSVTATGAVTGTTDDGIEARNDGTGLTVSAAAVTGGEDAIDARNDGTGVLSVTATGAVTGGTGYGIMAANYHSGTDLTVSAAAVTGGRYGIRAANFGSGALSVTATGAVTGTSDDGIFARNSVSGTDLTVTAAAVTGGYNGIYADNRGSGALSVTATGAVTGTSGNGITAFNPYTDGTNLTVMSAAAVTGGRFGILALSGGRGALSVTATGAVTGTTNDGIRAFNSGTDLTVSAAPVTGGDNGIVAVNDGTGALSVTATGAVTGTTFDGIRAFNSGTDLTVSAADVTGGQEGIDARNFGTGALSITATGAVTGGTGYGIRTQTGLGKSSVITLNAGAMVSGGAGNALFNDDGNSATTVHAGAGIAGAIRLGNGSDDLTFDGGSFAGVTQFDGGDDAGSADGYIDTLAFRNVSGSLDVATAVNWERVVVGAGAVITVNGATLTTEKLGITDGGRLSMQSGAAETFVLGGDLEIAEGGGLLMEVFSESSFDTFLVMGDAVFDMASRIDFLFDLDPSVGDFMLAFLTAESLDGFGNLSFGFTGLDPRDTASVAYDEMRSALVLSVDRQDSVSVAEPGALGLLAGGLLGLFGLGRRRRPSASI